MEGGRVRLKEEEANSGKLAGESIGLAGFEPAASCTRGRRSTKLSHSPN